MTSSQGVFHYTQENILYAALYGSRNNYEQIILNYHSVEANPSILINGGFWGSISVAGVMVSDMWNPAVAHGNVCSRLTMNQGTFSDYHESNNEYMQMVGGTFNLKNTQSGIFADGDITNDTSWYNQGSRLSKN